MKHCMLLWKKPSAKPLQTQIDCAFDVFSVIRDLREEYSPHFIRLTRKKHLSRLRGLRMLLWKPLKKIQLIKATNC